MKKAITNCFLQQFVFNIADQLFTDNLQMSSHTTPNTLVALNIFSYISDVVKAAVATTFGTEASLDGASVELPRQKTHGDFATNVAMLLSKQLGLTPKEIAQKLVVALAENPYFAKVEVAGPGFINISTTSTLWHDWLSAVLAEPTKFGHSKIGSGKKVLVEFVSANPTGPMHVGHSRGAVFGDVLSNLLETSGYEVTREFYINDAGAQIKILAQSLFIRYKQLLGYSETLEEGMYAGEYMIPIAQKLRDTHGESLLTKPFEEVRQELQDFCVTEILELIKNDLAALKVYHNSFVSELHDLQEQGLVAEAVDVLKSMDLLYQGVLEAPKGIEVEDWQPEEQTIFRSTKFGDDVDRVVQRTDGSYTYFAGDLGLALHRVKRGVTDIIMVLGADHIGFVKRLKCMVKALSNERTSVDVPIVQMVNLIKEGQPFKMSKRSGNFITALDVIDEVGVDALRFMMLSRKNDTVVDFDFQKVKEQSKDNPAFYVQYAHARCASILRTAESEMNARPQLAHAQLLTSEVEKDLIKKVAMLPRVIEQAATTHEPHKLIYFLIELATEFHSLWSHGNTNADIRFIVPGEKTLTEARLLLVTLVQLAIKTAFRILNIEPLDRM